MTRDLSPEVIGGRVEMGRLGWLDGVWRYKEVDAAAEIGREGESPRVSAKIQPWCGRPNLSRETKFSEARTRTSELKKTHFPCSADHEQDWQPYPVDPSSAKSADHTYKFKHAGNLMNQLICVSRPFSIYCIHTTVFDIDAPSLYLYSVTFTISIFFYDASSLYSR